LPGESRRILREHVLDLLTEQPNDEDRCHCYHGQNNQIFRHGNALKSLFECCDFHTIICLLRLPVSDKKLCVKAELKPPQQFKLKKLLAQGKKSQFNRFNTNHL
jgi:hypothetical protein